MKKKYLLTAIFMILVIQQYIFSVNINFLDTKMENEKIKNYVNNFIDIVKNKDMKKFYELLNNKINVVFPMTYSEIKISKNDFISKFNLNNKKINSITYYYGVLFDDDYTLKNFNHTSYKNMDFNILISSSISSNDYRLTIFSTIGDLAVLYLEIKNNKIVFMGTSFAQSTITEYFNLLQNDDYIGYIGPSETYLYKDENMNEKIMKLKRGELVTLIKSTDKHIIDHDLIKYDNPDDIIFTYMEGIVVDYVMLPEHNNIKGYLLSCDRIMVPRDIKKDEEAMYRVFINKQYYISKINNLDLLAYPNQNAEVYRKVRKGEKLLFIYKGKEDVINGIKGNWVRVQSELSQIGWCFDGYLDKQENNNLTSKFYIPTINSLRFRETPDLKGKFIRSLIKGEKLELLETGKSETINGLKGTWVKVKTEKGEIGWCFDAYLEEVKN